jgi:hypothetical protein
VTPADGPARFTPVRIRIAALLLFLVCLAGIVHGLRAAVAQVLYHQAKYGSAHGDVFHTLSRCAAADRLYPHNYYFAMWAAERAYYTQNVAADQTVALLDAAQRWCDAGLAMNRHKSSLRLLKTRLLGRESPERASAYWEEYVGWNFWNPHNHAVLVELYLAEGRFGKASRALRWVKGSKYYGHAQQAVQKAWANEMKPPAHMPP